MRTSILVFVTLFTVACANAFASTAANTTDPNHPFVKQLEAQYQKYLEAGRAGNVAGYLKTRTSEVAIKMAKATPDLLRKMSSTDFDPKEFQFVRVDRSGNVARMVFQKIGTDKCLWEAVMFTNEEGTWKIGHIVEVLYAGDKAKDTGGLNELLNHRRTQLPSS